MEIEKFKSKLNKPQLNAMAEQLVKESIDTNHPLDVLAFAKRLLHFSKKLTEEAEKEGKLVWDNSYAEYSDMNYTTGGAIYDWSKDPVYNDLASQLSARTELLKLAVNRKEPLFDEEGIEVPKCPIKGYRKDTINVKI